MKLIENSRILFMDSGPLIRLLEYHPDYYPVLSKVLDTVYEKTSRIVFSPVTLHKISLQAYTQKNSLLARQYREFFSRSRFVMVREIDLEISAAAAQYRAEYDLSFEESLQLATAYHSGADTVLTENESWKNYLDISVFTLKDISTVF